MKHRSRRKKTARQLDAVAKQRNQQLSTVASLAPGFSCQGAVGEFVDLYVQAEVVARKLQTYYHTDTKGSGKDELRVDVLKGAVKHFRLPFDEEEIESLFKGGAGKRGSKSARQLRNGYIHNLSKEDLNEIHSKSKKYAGSLRRFIAIQVYAT